MNVSATVDTNDNLSAMMNKDDVSRDVAQQHESLSTKDIATNASSTCNEDESSKETKIITNDEQTPPSVLKKLVRWQETKSAPIGDPSLGIFPEEETEAPSDATKKRTVGDSEASLLPPPKKMKRTRKTSKPAVKTQESQFASMEQQLQRMEAKIKYAAKVELAYLNKSKKLREYRRMLTHRYESMAHNIEHLMQVQNYEGPAPQKAVLPPLPVTSNKATPRHSSTSVMSFPHP